MDAICCSAFSVSSFVVGAIRRGRAVSTVPMRTAASLFKRAVTDRLGWDSFQEQDLAWGQSAFHNRRQMCELLPRQSHVTPFNGASR